LPWVGLLICSVAAANRRTSTAQLPARTYFGSPALLHPSHLASPCAPNVQVERITNTRLKSKMDTRPKPSGSAREGEKIP
jgi:hypothetical protein